MNYQQFWKVTADFFEDRFIQRALYALFVVIAAISLVIAVENIGDKTLLADKYEQAKIRGQYSVDGGVTFTDFSDYKDINLHGVNNLIVRGRLRGGLKRSEELYMFMDYITVSVYINGSIVYASEETADYCWDSVKGTQIIGSDVVTFELNTIRPVRYAKGFEQFFEKLSKSTKTAVLFHELDENTILLLGDIILIILGFVMILNGVETQHSVGEKSYGLISCGLATVLGAVTCFINPRYITLIIYQYELVEYIDTILQTFTVTFIFVYFRRFLKQEENQRRATGLVVVAYTVVAMYLLWSSIGYPAGSLPIILEIIASVIISLHYLWLFIRDSREVKDRDGAVALGAACLLVACTVLEMLGYLYSGVFFVGAFEFGLVGFAMVQFWFIIKKMSQARREAIRLRELENELTKAQVNAMMSQIQPHFLYNALSTIRALCVKDPQRAREAIDLLSKYLRANMESLSTKESIPITKELEHVDCYLSIEKYRFGDKLNVEYDVKATDFKIPSMTVQTMAENAVKHGLLAKPEGGTLKISTYETEYSYVVDIADDGIGFDTSDGKHEQRIHVGIENSRKRLAAMCGGTLSIGSRVGKGTTVSICIPKNWNE